MNTFVHDHFQETLTLGNVYWENRFLDSDAKL